MEQISRLFIVAVLALLGVGICEGANLTAITWRHDINTQALLEDALKTSQAIVADVRMGYHKSSYVEEPVMDQKRPTSDFSLVEFITQAIEYHNKNAQNVKIIQLNFLKIKSLQQSIHILLKKHREIKFPIWLHADIVNGPGSDVWQDPVEGNLFIEEVKEMHNVVLSIGWKTYWSPDSKVFYTNEHIEAMKQMIEKSKINTPDYKDMSINFPIRAAFALKSQSVLRNFYDRVKTTNAVTYTVQSLAGDIVDPKELEAFIKSYGIENVYVDLPDDLRKQINLSNSASSLIQFGLLNSIMLFIGYFFRNGFH